MNPPDNQDRNSWRNGPNDPYRSNSNGRPRPAGYSPPPGQRPGPNAQSRYSPPPPNPRPQPGVEPASVETQEQRRQRAIYGLQTALRRALTQNDGKEVARLLKSPQLPQATTLNEFRRAFRVADKRHTADGLRRVLKVYDTASGSGDVPYLAEQLGTRAEQARNQLAKIEAKHSKLLADWQMKVSRNKDYIRDQDVMKEKVVDVYYRHKIHILMLSIVPILLFLLNLILYVVFTIFLPVLIPINVVILIINLIWFGWTYNDWSNDYLMITNRRVLQYEKVALFSEEKRSLMIERVEQVKYEANRGLFEFIFRIGTVTITGAGKIELVFNRVYLPDRIRKEINDAKMAYMKGRGDFRGLRMENQMRNKLLGEELKKWDDEPVQVEAVRRSEQGFWQTIVPSKPVDEGNDTLIFRRHPIFLYKNWIKVFMIYGLLIVVGLFGLPVLFGLGIGPLNIGIFVVYVGLFLWNTVLVWYYWEDWYNDRYILSMRDITDVEKKPLGLDEEKQVITLAKVQDLELSQPSFISKIFDYGNVRVTTAGAGEPIVFRNVPEPDSLRAEISRRMEFAKNLAEDNNDKVTLDYFAHYHKIYTASQNSLKDEIINEVRNEIRNAFQDRPPPAQ